MSGFKVSYISIPFDNFIDMKRILSVNYYTLGILLNLDCPRSDSVFEEVGRHTFFFL